MCAGALSRVRLFATPRTVAHQAPLSMGFSRQEYWSGLPLPSPGDLPDPGIELVSLASPASAPPGTPSPIYTSTQVKRSVSNQNPLLTKCRGGLGLSVLTCQRETKKGLHRERSRT